MKFNYLSILTCFWATQLGFSSSASEEERISSEEVPAPGAFTYAGEERILNEEIETECPTDNLTPRSLVYFSYPEPDFIVYYSETSQIINHFAYSLSYNEEFEQANWVAYRLTNEMLSYPVCERDDSFKKDPLVVTGSATDSDYRNSGYSRGHLAPAADMLWNETAMNESFYFSNMSPQEQDFNNGIWKELEEQVREWARENEEVFVVTGPVLDKESYPTIGKNDVAVPEKFYKVILDYKEPEVKAIGFVVPHEDSDEDLETYMVSVDTVEEITGFDFFYSLPDEVEEEIKESVSYWE